MNFFAVASPGTEKALRDELCEIGLKGVRLNQGGIPFRGDWRDGWRACLYSRIAQRIQVLLGKFEVQSPGQLYDAVRSLDWTPYISPRQTMAVGIFCRSRLFSHSGATALKVKDAVVDQIRYKYGDRPNIDRYNPDVRIFVYISDAKVKLYLDLSGDPLHKRGYRLATGAAPIRENIAAALLRISGWDRKSPIADPMCGSGTIPIEAALQAGNIAPGLFRREFGFERWNDFDSNAREKMAAARQEAWAARSRQIPPIFASDNDAAVLAAASRNARAAGVKIRLRQVAMQDLQLSSKVKIVVTNPPYDERIAMSASAIGEIGAALSRMHGVRLCILSGNTELNRAIPAAPLLRVPIKNGDLDCECLTYKIA